MNHLTEASGAMLVKLQVLIDKTKELDASLWDKYQVGIEPKYAYYGIPEKCSVANAFMLAHSYAEEIVRKKSQLDVLDSLGIEGAIKAFSEM